MILQNEPIPRLDAWPVMGRYSKLGYHNPIPSRNINISSAHDDIDKSIMPSAPFIAVTRINSTTKDLLTNIFDLSPLEVEILLFLIANNDRNLTLEELAKETNRDKSTAFRSLQKLVNLGICIKEAKTMKGGGYYHTYNAIDMKSFKLLTERKVREIQESFDRLLKRFEQDLDKQVSSFYKKKQK